MKKLNIRAYESFPVSVRFFYRKTEPEKSRAEIRTPLLPGAIIFAKPKEEKRTPQNKKGIFNLPMELSSISVPLDGNRLRYKLKGELLLRQQKSKQAYFVLERHGKVELGSLETNANDLPPALISEISDLELFAKQIFKHRILRPNRQLVASPESSNESSNGISGGISGGISSVPQRVLPNQASKETVASASPKASSKASSKILPEALPKPLPLVEKHLDDVLSIYFFPEALSAKQQNLLTENQKKTLQEEYQIEFTKQFEAKDENNTKIKAKANNISARYKSAKESHTWSPSYSRATFTNPRFRELRNSGKLWQYFRRYKDTLQILYNLRYTSNLTLPDSSVLQREILSEESKKGIK